MTPTRELWFVAPHRVEVRRGELPKPASGEVLVRALASGISQGTELLLYRGEGSVPFDPSLGDGNGPTFPRRYGYAWVGEVVDRGPEVPDLLEGMQVFALAPHGDAHVLPYASLRRIDSTVPAERAVLAANLETALNCLWDSRASLGDRVLVIGAGVVGLLVAWLCNRVGAEVCIVEPSPSRRTMARSLGILAIEPSVAAEAAADADIVVEASGNPSALQLAIARAGMEARVVVVSNYGARTHALNLGHDFHRRRLTLLSSQVSELPPDRRARWTTARRFAVVRELLEEPLLDRLISSIVAFDDAPKVYEQLGTSDWLQIVFEYS